MKKSNLFTLLCCLLLCCFGMEVYAQGNNTQQYSDDEFEFEFEIELIYADDAEGEDDEDSDDDDEDDDSDDDDEDDDSDSDDDDDSEAEDALIGVQINVENSGESIIDANIFFRAYLSDETPETTPDTYDAQEILYLLDLPLQPDESREVFIDLSEEKGRGRVVIVWPLIDADKSGKEDTPFATIIIPKTEISDKITIDNFASIKTYPNPTIGILNIDIPNDISVSQIIIYNETGQAIKTFDGNKNDAIQLDLSDLPRGVYFAAMKNEQKQTIHYSKVFIHR